MRPAAALAALAAVALVAAGCASPEQRGAEEAVARLAGGAEIDCTSNPQTWFVEGAPAEVFVCVARRPDSGCDRYRVRRRDGGYSAALVERRVDCSLPG